MDIVIAISLQIKAASSVFVIDAILGKYRFVTSVFRAVENKVTRL